MPSYGYRIPEPDRWAVVEYVRSLQAANGQAPQRAAAPVATPPQQTEPPASPTPAPGQPAAQNAPAPAPGAAPVVPAAQGPAPARP
jgi:hypothetical protein